MLYAELVVVVVVIVVRSVVLELELIEMAAINGIPPRMDIANAPHVPTKPLAITVEEKSEVKNVSARTPAVHHKMLNAAMMVFAKAGTAAIKRGIGSKMPSAPAAIAYAFIAEQLAEAQLNTAWPSSTAANRILRARYFVPLGNDLKFALALSAKLLTADEAWNTRRRHTTTQHHVETYPLPRS